MFFRLLVLFFTVATIVLSTWSLVGSYKNEAYLTNNYLLGFQLSNLNLSAILTEASKKRDVIPEPVQVHLIPSRTLKARDNDLASLTSLAGGATSLIAELNGANTASLASILANAASDVNLPTSAIAALTTANANSVVSELKQLASTVSIPSSLATLAAEFDGDISSLLSSIASEASVSDLGLSDFYNVGFWGYCKGNLENGTSQQVSSKLGGFGKSFSNKNVNYTYCSKPKAGYKLDPLTLFRHEIVEKISEYANGISTLTGGLSDSFAAQLVNLASNISYDSLGLPGDLKQKLTLLHNLTVAGFALILAGACLAFISFVFQIVGLTCSPNSAFLSCCNFLLMVIVFLVVLVGSALSTAAYIFVRRIVNDHVDEYGVKTFLSIQFYAFSWSAAVAALLFLVLSIVGYCCGCFHHKPHYEPANEIHYDHKP